MKVLIFWPLGVLIFTALTVVSCGVDITGVFCLTPPEQVAQPTDLHITILNKDWEGVRSVIFEDPLLPMSIRCVVRPVDCNSDRLTGNCYDSIGITINELTIKNVIIQIVDEHTILIYVKGPKYYFEEGHSPYVATRCGF